MRVCKYLLMAAAVLLLLSACQSNSKSQSNPYKKVDQVMTQYFKAFIKNDGKTVNKFLAKSAELKIFFENNSHPDAVKKMGNRYTLKRFAPKTNQSVVYYRVIFYDPYPKPGSKDQVEFKLKKINSEWKVMGYAGIYDNYAEKYGGQNSTVEANQWQIIHKWGE